jgi:hypothetical protein
MIASHIAGHAIDQLVFMVLVAVSVVLAAITISTIYATIGKMPTWRSYFVAVLVWCVLLCVVVFAIL